MKRTPSGGQACKDIAGQLLDDVGAEFNTSWSRLVKEIQNLDSSVIVGCTFAGEKCSSADFEPISTTVGVCYTFNAKPPLRKVSGTGWRRGLQVAFDSQGNDMGYWVVIHNPNEPPLPFTRGVAVALNTTAVVSMRRVETVDETRYSSTSCRKGGHSGNLTFPHAMASLYSRHLCELNCVYSYTADQCGCVERSFYSTPESSRFGAARDCVLEDLCCEYEVFDTVSKQCNCPLECNSVDHSITASSSTNPDHTAAVNVYYESLIVETRTTEDSYTPFSLISDIGGNSGLFLGFTLLTVAEVVMWIAGEIRDRFYCVRCKVCLAKEREEEKEAEEV